LEVFVNAFRPPPALDDFLGWLAGFVQFPMAAGAGVGGLQYWFVKKGVGHGQLFPAGLNFTIAAIKHDQDS
jgi:hypothetical protein